jgi:hypothetical protein
MMHQLDLWLHASDDPATMRERLLAWGKAHAFPQLWFHVDNAAGLIQQGEESWMAFSREASAGVVELAIEQTKCGGYYE